MRIPFDTHTHTTISDGSGSPGEMFAAAAAAGASVVAVTDHLDMDVHLSDNRGDMSGAGDAGAYERLAEAKRGNRAAVKALIGVELGQAHRFPEEAGEWLDGHAYDFVLGSCHAVRGYEDFYRLDRRGLDVEAALRRYFGELLELCEWGKFDALAHMTYPMRYVGGDIKNHKAAVDAVFRAMIKNEIALEVNTHDIGKRNGKLSPEFPEIKRYRDLGGRLVTVGSDAHRVEAVGNGVSAGIGALLSAGFGECAYYEGRKAKFIKIQGGLWKN
ncbi:MAG: PHP domain-containing protein [Oscillospiraceae bacterium]|jgi:histidinol-phosphatase (PHP family)|nr:PHP domain-containing protein [Oscillospiraceae bacterium]